VRSIFKKMQDSYYRILSELSLCNVRLLPVLGHAAVAFDVTSARKIRANVFLFAPVRVHCGFADSRSRAPQKQLFPSARSAPSSRDSLPCGPPRAATSPPAYPHHRSLPLGLCLLALIPGDAKSIPPPLHRGLSNHRRRPRH